jgi:phosphoribosyl 1,2-cyclic phosphodiesterase
VLGSGSGGNCTYLSTPRVSVLVDLGFGRRSLERRFSEAHLGDGKIDAVFVTHGHIDHFSGVIGLACETQIPVFMTAGTFQEAPDLALLPQVEILRPGDPVTLGDLTVTPFAISHDSAEPVGFRFEAEGIRGALATDLGEITPEVADHLQNCDWLILESNHDENLLRLGPYPWPLKQRLLSRVGHLSNYSLAQFLTSDFDGNATHLFLAHLSRQNNDPQLAFDSASHALATRSLARSATACHWALHLTEQTKPSIVLDL